MPRCDASCWLTTEDTESTGGPGASSYAAVVSDDHSCEFFLFDKHFHHAHRRIAWAARSSRYQKIVARFECNLKPTVDGGRELRDKLAGI